MVIGLIVLAIGKLKLTPTITLDGVRARWYGLTLILTAFPFQWVVRQGFLALPSQIAQDGMWGMVISVLAVIGYAVLVALPFRERKI